MLNSSIDMKPSGIGFVLATLRVRVAVGFKVFVNATCVSRSLVIIVQRYKYYLNWQKNISICRRGGCYREVDGVGGATAVAAEEGVEVDGLGVGLLDWGSGVGGVQPFLGEEERDETVGAGDGQREGTCAEGGAVDEDVELVGGVAVIRLRIEGDGEDIAVDASRDDVHGWQRATTDDDA